MSSNNNNEAAMGFALVGAVAAMMMIFLYAIVFFLACLLTIVALFAWERPLVMFGKTICEPQQARVFIGSGVVGAVAVPVFAVFCAAIFNFRIQSDWLFYLISGGYSFFAIGAAMHMEEERRDDIPEIEHTPPAASALPPSSAKPFEYASWDDEDERQ